MIRHRHKLARLRRQQKEGSNRKRQKTTLQLVRGDEGILRAGISSPGAPVSKEKVGSQERLTFLGGSPCRVGRECVGGGAIDTDPTENMSGKKRLLALP